MTDESASWLLPDTKQQLLAEYQALTQGIAALAQCLTRLETAVREAKLPRVQYPVHDALSRVATLGQMLKEMNGVLDFLDGVEDRLPLVSPEPSPPALPESLSERREHIKAQLHRALAQLDELHRREKRLRDELTTVEQQARTAADAGLTDRIREVITRLVNIGVILVSIHLDLKISPTILEIASSRQRERRDEHRAA